MEDGLPRPSEYRRFKVKTVGQNDDYAAMEEVLTRRLRAYLAERDKPTDQRCRRFAYPPQLLLVDGGRGQLSVAIRVVNELGLEDEIPVAALAKQFEEVFVPGQADPIRINRTADALYLLQRIRDEAHRFAVTYHRQLRGKRMTASALDGIPGRARPGASGCWPSSVAYGRSRWLRSTPCSTSLGCLRPWPGPSCCAYMARPVPHQPFPPRRQRRLRRRQRAPQLSDLP